MPGAFTVGELIYKITGDTSNFNTAVSQTDTKITNLGKKMSDIGGKLSTFVTLPLLAAGGAALKSAADFEKHKVAFETMLGSAEKAQALLGDIEKFSASTPFQLPGLIVGAKRLLAFGTQAQDIVKTMTMLGNAAQGDQEILDRLTLAYGKLQAKGKATLEELNMFTEAGVPIMKELAKQYGVTTDKLFEYITQGKVGFADVQKALESMTTGQGQFAGLIEKQAETLAGKMSTLQDNIGLLGKSFGEILLPAVSDIVTGLTGVVQSFAALDEDTKKMILTMAGVAIAIGPVTKGIGGLISIVPKLGTAFTVIAAHPVAATIIALAAGFIALGVAIKGAIDEAEKFKKLQEGTFTSLGKVSEILAGKYKPSLEEAKKLQGDLTTQHKEAEEKINKLKKAIKDLTDRGFAPATEKLKEELKMWETQNLLVNKSVDVLDKYIKKNSEATTSDKGRQTELQDLSEETVKKMRADGEQLLADWQAVQKQRMEWIREGYAEEAQYQAELEAKKEAVLQRELERQAMIRQAAMMLYTGLQGVANAYFDYQLSKYDKDSKAYKKAQLDQFNVNKAIGVANATIAAYEAGVQTFKTVSSFAPPPFPAIAAGAAVGLNLAQAALILAQKPPKFATGGYVTGNAYRGDTQPALLNSGEAVLNPTQQQRLLDAADGKSGGGGTTTLKIIVQSDRQTAERTVELINNREFIIDLRSVREL